jgi:hypothetical protein
MLLRDVIQMGSSQDTRIEDVTVRARALHYLLTWLVDDGIDIAEYTGLQKSGLGELVGTPMARCPSVFVFFVNRRISGRYVTIYPEYVAPYVISRKCKCILKVIVAVLIS